MCYTLSREEMRELETEMNWIDCKKELPEKFETVLVWTTRRDGATDSILSWINDDGEWEIGSTGGWGVTHWMEITEPK